jgi:sterol desaturase/sphingolipid hydroxylase (fatty acid hydroxylase superfamily)
MTDDEVDQLARERLAADEARITGPRRRNLSLAQVGGEFWRHPSPWLISSFLLLSAVARLIVGGGSWWELAIPGALVALFPVIEWLIHVGILHWRPRRVAGLEVDSLLARKHREHHADPRDLPLVFIPWQVLTWLLPAYVVVALLAVPSRPAAWSLLVSVYALKFGYEWTHYLIHSDYRPRHGLYRAVWRNHRQHHNKNEHYWFTVTSSGTADRLFGTYRDPDSVPTSRTAKNLHGAA